MQPEVLRHIGHLLPLRTSHDGYKQIHHYLQDLTPCEPPSILITDFDLTNNEKQMKALVTTPQHAEALTNMVHHYYPNIVLHIIGHHQIFDTISNNDPAKSRPQLSATVPWLISENADTSHQPQQPAQPVNLRGEGPKAHKRPAASTPPGDRSPHGSSSGSQETSGSPGLEGFVHLRDESVPPPPEELQTTIHVGRPPRVASARRLHPAHSYSGYIIHLRKGDTLLRAANILRKHLRCRQDQIIFESSQSEEYPHSTVVDGLPSLHYLRRDFVGVPPAATLEQQEETQQQQQHTARYEHNPADSDEVILQKMRSSDHHIPTLHCNLPPTYAGEVAENDMRTTFLVYTTTDQQHQVHRIRYYKAVSIRQIHKALEEALDSKTSFPYIHQDLENERIIVRFNPAIIAEKMPLMFVDQETDAPIDVEHLSVAQKAFLRHLNSKLPEGATDDDLMDEAILEFDDIEIPLRQVVDVDTHVPPIHEQLPTTTLHYIIKPSGKQTECYTAYCFELNHVTTVEQLRRALARHLHIAYSRIQCYGVEFIFHDTRDTLCTKDRIYTTEEIPLPMTTFVTKLTHTYARIISNKRLRAGSDDDNNQNLRPPSTPSKQRNTRQQPAPAGRAPRDGRSSSPEQATPERHASRPSHQPPPALQHGTEDQP
eukprot:6492249-Amphidinium_carterae.1